MKRSNWIGILVVGVCFFVGQAGCDSGGGMGDGGDGSGGSGGDGGGSGGSGSGSATFSENASAVGAATTMAEQMAAGGSDSASIQSALVAQLSVDPQVAGAAVDPDNDVVYADFINGETQSWMVIDDATDPDAVLPDDEELLASAKASLDAARGRAAGSRPSKVAKKSGFAAQPAPDISFWNLPGSNKALLANGLTFFHQDWLLSDSTLLVKAMLEARGYQVTHEPLALKHFDNLTQYGVILIESHGLWRAPDFWLELINRHPFTNEPEVANCGGTRSRQTVLTTTEATAASREANKEDIRCGRLALRNVLRDWNDDGKKTTKQFYEVSPNYIAQHDQGKFPNSTLMILNACRGYGDDLLSPFQDVLASKCDRGSFFLGWTQGLHVFYGVRAVLNLFQLMTVSNEELIIDVPHLNKKVTVLSKATPPRDGQWAGLNSGAYTQIENVPKGGPFTIAKRGAYFMRFGQDAHIAETILAPQPLFVVGRDSNVTSGVGSKPRIAMYSDASPAVTVGGNGVSVSPISLCCSSEWTVTGPDAVFGDIVVSQDGRSGGGVKLHRWRPQIKLTGNNGGLAYSVIFTLQARATVGFSGLRTSAWSDAPTAMFDRTSWDPEGSSISWTVSGEETIDKKHYKYEGTGLRSFGTDEGGSFESNGSGTSVSFEAYGKATYTTTITNLDDNSMETVTTEQIATVSGSGIGLSPTWTVSSGSVSDDGGFGGTGQVTWNAFGADPAFDDLTEPR